MRQLIAMLAILVGFFHMSCALRMMTFNVWSSGGVVYDGLTKVANHIKLVNPDVVALQEMHDWNRFQKLIETLGDEWSGVQSCNKLGAAIMTRHKIIDSYEDITRGMNIHIQLKSSGQLISVWAMHLEYRMDGSYASFTGKSLDEILRGEFMKKIPGVEKSFDSRVQNIKDLLHNKQFVKQMRDSDRIPVIVAGDFNSPSHRDWTEATKNVHNGNVVEWPVSKMLESVAGMVDSFREVHPDPVEEPGVTWPVYRKDDTGLVVPKDRIDFIFYRGNLRPTASSTFNGHAPIIDDGGNTWKTNEWPSDHWAVYTDFEKTNPKNGYQASFEIDSAHWTTESGTMKKCAIIH